MGLKALLHGRFNNISFRAARYDGKYHVTKCLSIGIFLHRLYFATLENRPMRAVSWSTERDQMKVSLYLKQNVLLSFGAESKIVQTFVAGLEQ